MINKLYKIKKDLNKHKHKKEDLKVDLVNQRLQKSLKSYYHDLTLSLSNVYNKSPEKILKDLT